MLSTFAHTRSLLSVDLLITFEGRSENSDDVPKEKPLTALASVTVVTCSAIWMANRRVSH